MQASPRVSFVLPLYNEAAQIPGLLERVRTCAREHELDFEIIAVDDGSRDATLAALQADGGANLNVQALPENRGKGAAVRCGVLASRADRIVVMDADLSTDLEALPRLLAALEDGADVCLGSRHAAGAQLLERQPLVRESLGRGFLALSRRVFAPEVQDFTCGFKGFRGAAGRAIFARARIDGWAYDVETVVIARRLGLKIDHVAVRWRHDSGSKVRLLPAVAGSLRDLARIARNARAGHYESEDAAP